MARPREGLHRARPDDHSARRRHRLHRRRDPADAGRAVINTEKLEAMTEVELRRAAGRRREPSPTIWTRRRRRHAARDRRGRARGLRVRGRSDVGRRVVHRRQRRDERRRQEGGAVGHRARQPRVVAHGDARRATGSKSTRLDHNLGKIHDAPRRDASSCSYFDADGKTLERTRDARDPGRARSARKASARTSPTSSSPACPACRRKAATA